MSTALFGYTARKQAQSSSEPWLRWAGGAFFGGLVLATVAWWNGLIDPHEPLKQALFAAAILVSVPLAIVAVWRGTFRRPFAWMTLAAVGSFLLSAVASWIVSPDGWTSFLGVAGSVSSSALVTAIACLSFLLAGTLASLGWKPSATPAYAVLLLLIPLAVMQRLGWLDLSSGGVAARVFSPLGNQQAFTWLIAVMGVFAAARELVEEEFVRPLETWLRRGFLVIGLGWLSLVDLLPVWIVLLAAAFAMLAAAVFSKEIRVPRQSLAWIALLAIVAIVGLVVAIPQPTAVPGLVALSPSESWRTVRAGLADGHWLLGRGQGRWLAVFDLIRPAALNVGSLYAIRFDAGGAYLWTILLQQGILGALAFLFVLVATAVRTMAAVRTQPERLPLAFAVWTGLGALFVAQPYAWGVVLLLAALGYAVSGTYETTNGFKAGWSAALGIGGMLILCAVPAVIARVRADGALRSAQLANDVPAKRVQIRRAEALAPWSAEAAFAGIQIDTAWLSAGIREGVKDPAAFQNDLAQAIDHAKFVTGRWPTDPNAWLAQGALYAAIFPVTKGADQFAVQAYQQGAAYAPSRPGFSLGMAQVFLQRAEALNAPATSDATHDKARAEARLEQLRLASEWFRRALDQKPDDVTAQYAYASTLARSGNLAAAVPLFERMTSAQPERADLSLEYAVLLAATSRTPEAIALAEKIGTKERAYLDSRRLLADWYERQKRWPEAIAALRQLPADEQATTAFRQRINKLQSQKTAPTP